MEQSNICQLWRETVLSSSQFQQWCREHELSAETVDLVARIRFSPPARRVQGRAGNMYGNYPSRKMGVAGYEMYNLPIPLGPFAQGPVALISSESAAADRLDAERQTVRSHAERGNEKPEGPQPFDRPRLCNTYCPSSSRKCVHAKRLETR